MKKQILLLLCCTFSLLSFAQVKLSVETGAAYTGHLIEWIEKDYLQHQKDIGSYPFNINPGIRPICHLRLSHHLAKNFHLHYGIGYRWFGHKQSEKILVLVFMANGTVVVGDSITFQMESHYAGFNLGLKYVLWEKINFSLEGSLYRTLSARQKTGSYVQGQEILSGVAKWGLYYNQIPRLRPYQVACSFSVSYQLTPWMALGVGCTASLVHLYQFEKGVKVASKLYPAALNASLCFDITLKKGKQKPMKF